MTRSNSIHKKQYMVYKSVHVIFATNTNAHYTKSRVKGYNSCNGFLPPPEKNIKNELKELGDVPVAS